MNALRAVGNGESEPRRRMARDERQSLILRHASEVFGTRGYHSVSMEDIAEHAGISKALIYQHFESKDHLYLAVIRRFQSEVRQMVTAAWGPQGSAEVKMWSGLLAFFRWVDKDRGAWGVLYRDAVAIEGTISLNINTLRGEIAERVSLLLEHEMLANNVHPAVVRTASASAHAFVGAIEALADFWTDHPEHTPESLATIAMNTIWLGYAGVVDGKLWLPPIEEEQEAVEVPDEAGNGERDDTQNVL
ncbi:MAG: TetR/AcrR family transcriptional regulator [Thermoleophilaceae bacterium]|nr:TetR/AcrR family transcriptional regulator [Thermoleophilaceae bacterium]